jgi:superfamily I DNA/RNA helicase
VAIIIETLLKKIHYEAFLQKEDDFAQRWENVKELINFSTLVAQAGGAVPFTRQMESDGEVDEDGMNFEAEVGDVSWGSAAGTFIEDEDDKSSIAVKTESGSSRSSKGKRKTYDVIDLATPDPEEEEEDIKPVVKKTKGAKVKAEKKPAKGKADKKKAKVKADPEVEVEAESFTTLVDETSTSEEKTPLRVFLEASTLSTDMEQDDQDGKAPKVTIATTHAAKGWVFISFPPRY